MGEEKVLHSFAGGADGENPFGGLIEANGTLYGTTRSGGTSNAGTVYSIRDGKEKVLRSFAGGSDGAEPRAALLAVNGTLYGTTVSGGTSDKGTAYSISTIGTEIVLHSFAGGSDGADPRAPLIDVNDNVVRHDEQGRLGRRRYGFYIDAVTFRVSTL